MILILNFTPHKITTRQRDQITATILDHADKRFVCRQPKVKVLDVRHMSTPELTVKEIRLDAAQWRTYAIAPYIPATFPTARALMDAVNAARGYDWPVVREVGSGEWES